MISRAQRTVSNVALYALTGIPPIEYTIENRIAIYKVKKGTTTASIPPYELPGNILRNGHPTERTPITTSIQNDPNITTCPVNHTHTIYTDGSKINGQVGAAVVIFDNNPPEVSPSIKPLIHTYKLDDKCSVFQAELIAIYKAVSLATTNGMDCIIHSDSQAAIEGISNPQSTNNIILGIKECARSSPDRHVCVKWVRGHAGVKGNEAADHAAKNAAMSSLEPSYSKPPISHFKALSRRLTAIKWDKAWKQSCKGQVTRTFLDDINLTYNKPTLDFDYHTTQFLTGHGEFACHLSKFNPIPQACECGEIESSNHILRKCTRRHHLTIPFRVKHTIGDNSFNKIIKDKEIFDDFKSLCKTLVSDLRNHHNT